MLKYVGNGNFLPGFPARDLTEEEVIQFCEAGRPQGSPVPLERAVLVESGLWEEEAPPVSPPISASKLARIRGERDVE